MNNFKSNLDTAVITTRYVIKSQSPILYVFHFEDGNWQFNSRESSLNDEDYMVISLREILEKDESLQELETLPPGFEATRLSKTQPWEINKLN